jgi:hypothetical protein
MGHWNISACFFPAVVCSVLAASLVGLRRDIRLLFLLPAVYSIAFFALFATAGLAYEAQLPHDSTSETLLSAAAFALVFAVLGEILGGGLLLFGLALYAKSFQRTQRLTLGEIMVGIAIIGVATAIALSFFP